MISRNLTRLLVLAVTLMVPVRGQLRILPEAVLQAETRLVAGILHSSTVATAYVDGCKFSIGLARGPLEVDLAQNAPFPAHVLTGNDGDADRLRRDYQTVADWCVAQREGAERAQRAAAEARRKAEEKVEQDRRDYEARVAAEKQAWLDADPCRARLYEESNAATSANKAGTLSNKGLHDKLQSAYKHYSDCQHKK